MAIKRMEVLIAITVKDLEIFGSDLMKFASEVDQ